MDTVVLPDGATVCWDPDTGRGFVRPTDPRARDIRKRQLRIGSPRDHWIPQRSRHVIASGGTVWGPLPLVRTASGHGYAALSVDPELWSAINGSRTVDAIATRLNRSTSAVLTALAPLMHIERQAVQLWPHRVPVHRLRHLVRPQRPRYDRDPSHVVNGKTSLAGYHEALVGSERQFHERETTVAHVLALPHPALRGNPYGKALRAALRKRHFAVDGRVVEVGCGTGELARDWGPSPSYLRLDRSPGLLEAQGQRVPYSCGVLADATQLPLADQSVGCLISNEVLADLPSTRTPEGWDNAGARAFVREIARVLEPGGCAYLSEFGTLDGHAEEAEQLDHPEVSIQFRALAAYAQQCGLEAEVVPLAALLDLEFHAEQLARHSWHALRTFADSRGVSIETRCWTPATLPLPWPVEGLEWVSLSDEGPGPLITRFYALLLRR